MRIDRDISARMRDILTRDKVDIKEGFSTAMTKDLQKTLGDYFELSSPVRAEVSQQSDGSYLVSVTCSAARIRRFDTTYDVKRY